MNALIEAAVLVIIGLSGGLAVGSGFVAFLVVLDVIPRMAQITRSWRMVHVFEGVVVLGTMFWMLLDFFDLKLGLSPIGMMGIGLAAGSFVGMLAGALTEVLNVFPILAKRLGMSELLVWLLMAMVLGKVAGSLFEWLVYYG
jgi:stage V sporulation protein AB